MRSDDDECNYCRSRDELERVLSAFVIKKKTEPFPNKSTIREGDTVMKAPLGI